MCASPARPSPKSSSVPGSGTGARPRIRSWPAPAPFVLNYTGEQEFLAPQQAGLLAAINARDGVVPVWLSEEYRLRNRRMTKWFNIMTVNTRMLFLFVLLFLGKPTWYFFVDLTLLNFVLAFVLVRQNRMSGDLVVELESRSS